MNTQEQIEEAQKQLKNDFAGKNVEGDLVKLAWHRDGWLLSYKNEKEDYAGATVIPHEFINNLLTAQSLVSSAKAREEQIKKDVKIAKNLCPLGGNCLNCVNCGLISKAIEAQQSLSSDKPLI